MRRFLVVTLLAVAPTFVAPTDHAAAAGYKRCQDVIIRNSDGDVYTRTHGLWAMRVGCSRARKVARQYPHGAEGNAGPAPRPYGFRCSGGADGVACRKGKQRITWGYYVD